MRPPGVGRIGIPNDTYRESQWLIELAQRDNVPFDVDPVFGLAVPRHCPDVPDHVFRPRASWKKPKDYDAQANRLAQLFREKFAPFAERSTEAVRDAAPKVK